MASPAHRRTMHEVLFPLAAMLHSPAPLSSTRHTSVAYAAPICRWPLAFRVFDVRSNFSKPASLIRAAPEKSRCDRALTTVRHAHRSHDRLGREPSFPARRLKIASMARQRRSFRTSSDHRDHSFMQVTAAVAKGSAGMLLYSRRSA